MGEFVSMHGEEGTNVTENLLDLAGKSFCITGALTTLQKEGEKPLTRVMVTEMIKKRGGIVKSSVTIDLDFLVIGGAGSKRYLQGKKGSKILKAERQANTVIITETELLEALEY